MELYRGIPVSPGVAIGPALILDAAGMRIPQRRITPQMTEEEILRIHQALAVASAQTRETQQSISDRLGKHYGAIFAAHRLLLEDTSFIAELESLIRHETVSAETAVSRVIRDYVKTLESLGSDQSLALRAADLVDVEKRIQQELHGETIDPLKNLEDPVIILANDLSPSETASLDSKKVFAFATEHGGKTSHSAILANALQIPAVVGIGPVINSLNGSEIVIVDGTQGLLIINPDSPTIQRYRSILREQQHHAYRWIEHRDLLAQTRDGVRVELFANIEFPQESSQVTIRGAEGVGLYRTEFLYVGRTCDPTEEEHYQAYMSVIREVGNDRPIVIRTLDLGADKFPHMLRTYTPEKNPALGLRSVRFCLRNLPIFRTQLRAILRAALHGKVQMMFPMISTLLEIRQCKMILAEVCEDLHEEGIPFKKDIRIGTMIEVPSAAIMADHLAREVDFFSIGTNDLVQYTLATDRTNEMVANLFSATDPSVLYLIELVVQAVKKHQIELTICGEMSGEPLYIPLLLGMGIRRFSATPAKIPEVKKIIRLLDIPTTEQIAQTALRLETARDITSFLNRQWRQLFPDQVD